MAKGLLSARLGAGATVGFSQAAQYERDRPMRELRLREAKLRQEKAEYEFGEQQDNRGVRDAQMDEALAQAKLGAYTANTQNLQARTYDAFSRYNEDKDVRHLNTFLADAKRNPIGANLYGGYTRLDAINNVDYAEAEQLMRRAGFAEPAAFIDDPDMASQFVVATASDGSRSIVDVNKLQAMTGYTKHMTTMELEEAKLRAEVVKLQKFPNDPDSQLIREIAIENDITKLEAARLYMGVKQRANGSTVERLADDLQRLNPRLDRVAAMQRAAMILKSGGTASEREAYAEAELGGGSTGDQTGGAGSAGGTTGAPSPRAYKSEWDDVNNRKERTSAQKNADDVENTRVAIDELAGGADAYFNTDLSDPAERRKYTSKIRRLEQLSGGALTTEDKRVARNIRDLTHLGGAAGTELTAEETGILDHMLHGFQKYVSDNVEGEAARSSYETFRNIFRNALYGASLTKNETDAFDKAAGTLGQQLGPVLQQLQTQMHSLKSQLQSIYDYNDEYVAHYYVGTDLDTLDRMIEGIDIRLQEFRSRKNTKPRNQGDLPRINVRPQLSDEDAMRTMDDIAGGAE